MLKNKWVLTLYKKDNTIRKEFIIIDRTETEANNESMRYIENFKITNDWTLRPAKTIDLKLSELD